MGITPSGTIEQRFKDQEDYLAKLSLYRLQVPETESPLTTVQKTNCFAILLILKEMLISTYNFIMNKWQKISLVESTNNLFKYNPFSNRHLSTLK